MDDIVKEALDAFEVIEEVERHNREAFKDDVEFARLGKQWPEEIEKQRNDPLNPRPMLTINTLPSVIRQVVNDARQNRPAITVMPVEGGDKETAEVISGLIRNIEVQSRADIAYDTAVDNAASGGFGYWRVNVDYACDDTFDKDIVIRPIANPLSVFGDPYSDAADSSEWMSAFVLSFIPEARYRAKYGGKKEIDWDARWTDAQKRWLDSKAKTICVAEFWKRDEVKRELVLVKDYGPVFVDHIDKVKAELGLAFEVEGQSRFVPSYKVTQHTVSPLERLETVNWAGKYIPIVPVYGEEVNLEGKRHFRSLIRDAKDPARMRNYWRTTATEMVALAPRAPFIGRKGAFASDPNWNSVNSATLPYLEYDGPEAPQRQPFTGVPAGVLQEALSANDDIKAVTGIYDASLGARSNETSGRAIMARQREGDISTFHFIDNLTRAIRHTGYILLDLIPKVYTGERVVRVLGQDGKPVEAAQQGGASGQIRTTSDPEKHSPQAGIYNLGIGKYDLVVKAGPSFTSQREEAAAMLTELVRANGEAAPILGDLIVENMDIPGGDKAVKRLRAMLPPQVRAAEEGENPELAGLQQQLQQMAQIIEAGKAEMAAMAEDKSLEREKLAVEQYKAATERLTALGATITPDAVQQLVVSTIEDVIATAGLLPGEAHQAPVEPGVSMPEPMGMGMEAPMEPVGIAPPGQPEGPQL